MSTDRDNLLDPTHPRSPYNKFNYDSPYSYANPTSPNYDPSKKLTLGEFCLGALVMVCVWGLIISFVSLFYLCETFPGLIWVILIAVFLLLGVVKLVSKK